MKLLSSLLVGCGLVGAGLAAPSPRPQAVAEALLRPQLERLDGLMVEAERPPVPTSLAGQLSRLASAVLDHLSFFDIAISVTPVFAGDVDDAQMMTEVDGDLVVVRSGQSVRAIIWNPSSHTFYLDAVPSLRARLPMAILLVSLWLLFACLYLGRSAEDGQVGAESDSASASEGRRLLRLRDLRMRERLVEKPALDVENDAAGYL